MQAGDPESQRVKTASESRARLEEKHRLTEDPRYEHAKSFQREKMYLAIPRLKATLTPQDFGRIMDEVMIGPLEKEYDDNENRNDFGSRLKAAFLERMGEKAKDEITGVCSAQAITPSEQTRRLLDLLPFGQSAEAIGEQLGQIVNSGELSSLGDSKALFELARDSKIAEFEEFYGRSGQSDK